MARDHEQAGREERPAVADGAGWLADMGAEQQAGAERAALLARVQAVRAEAAAARERLAFLAEASRLLAASLDYETTLADVARLTVSRLADRCAIVEVEETGALRQLVAPEEPPGDAPRPLDPRALPGVPQALETGRATLYPEVPDSQLATMAPDAAQVRMLRELGIISLIVVPLVAHARILGALTLLTAASGRRYGPDDLAEAEELARRLAMAVDNARLHRALAECERELHETVGRLLVAQEEERRHIAYDLHDGLAQVATGTYQHLQAFAHHHRPPTPQGQAELDRVLELARRTVAEARRVVANLRPTELEDFGLAHALRLQVEELRAAGWEVAYDEALGLERLPLPIETALYRVAQEALTNLRKHAHTSRARVALESHRQTVRLEVQDWGRGFAPDAARPPGGLGERIGLLGMRERIASLGGRCTVESYLGVGTRVVAEVPVGPAADGRPHEQ